MNRLREIEKQNESPLLFLHIQDSLGPGVSLSRNHDGRYLYRARVLQKVIFENGSPEVHFILQLDRPISLMFEGGVRDTNLILCTTRYQGDSIDDIAVRESLIVSFSYIGWLEGEHPHSNEEVRLDMAEFKKNSFKWIGIGELSMRPPVHPLTEPPWGMDE